MANESENVVSNRMNLEGIIARNKRDFSFLLSKSLENIDFKCPACGSTNVIALAWVQINRNNQVVEYLKDNNNAFCSDCDAELTIVNSTAKASVV